MSKDYSDINTQQLGTAPVYGGYPSRFEVKPDLPKGSGVKVEEVVKAILPRIPAPKPITQEQINQITSDAVSRATSATNSQLTNELNYVNRNVDSKVRQVREEAEALITDVKASVNKEIKTQIDAIPKVDGVSPEKLNQTVTKTVTDYFKANPIKSGVTQAEVQNVVAATVGNEIGKQVSAEVTRQINNGIAATGDAMVKRVVPQAGVDITTELQKAIDDKTIRVIELPAGEWELSNSVNLNNMGGKVIKGQGEATILKMKQGTNKPGFMSYSYANLSNATFSDFQVDMNWSQGDSNVSGFQMTNASFITWNNVGVRNSGGNGFVLQGYVTKDKATGNGTSDCRLIQCTVHRAGLVQNPVEKGASGFGILIKDESLRNQVINCVVREVSCGMGIGGTDSINDKFAGTARQGAPKDTLVSGNLVVMADNHDIAYEPCGFTEPCARTNVIGNILPVSKDNGISIGRQSVVANNVIGETWNHGVACSGPGTKISNNEIWNVGIENSTRLKDSPVAWAAVALEDPVGCIVIGNTYSQDKPEASCDHMIKVVVKKGTPISSIGGNQFTGNTAQAGTIKKQFMFNVNINPLMPDVVVSESETENLKKLVSEQKILDPLRWVDPTKRFVAPITSWRTLTSAPSADWASFFGKASDTIPFGLINPNNGPGMSRDTNQVNIVKKIRSFNKPVFGFVQTMTTITPEKQMRPKADIIADCKKYVEYYGVDGVYFDNFITGWPQNERPMVEIFQSIYNELKTAFGKGFTIVGNSASQTIESVLKACDIVVSFNGTATAYLAANVAPDHYKSQSPNRFIHIVHSVENEEQGRKVLAKAESSNVATVLLSNQPYAGGAGLNNNLSSPLPVSWMIDMQADWSRRALYPAKIFSYSA